METRTLFALLCTLALAGCRTFPEACREASAGPGWQLSAPPAWAGEKLDELGWRRSATTHWFANGSDAYRVCTYTPSWGTPHCGGPLVAEFTRASGTWEGGIVRLSVCH